MPSKTHRIAFCKSVLPSVMDGSKALTSRVMRFGKDVDGEPDHYQLEYVVGAYAYFSYMGCYDLIEVKCPYGEPGDILRVKEGYRIISNLSRTRHVAGFYTVGTTKFNVELTQDEYAKWCKRKYPYRATPGRFMYNSLCRTTLINREVRVERLQDITKKDAIAEGIGWSPAFPEGYTAPGCPRGFGSAEGAFMWLWDSINTKHGRTWDDNPWVWRVRFERVAE